MRALDARLGFEMPDELNWKGRVLERVLVAKRELLAAASDTSGSNASVVARRRLPGNRREGSGRFLEDFQRVHGRRPRILHVGNIANNAYLNAKLLNQAGYDCDVICADYYHVMACPEWDDADYVGVLENHGKPDWTTVDLQGFQRPRWFAQGTQAMCLDYLLAQRTGDQARADQLWISLGESNGTRPAAVAPAPQPETRSSRGAPRSFLGTLASESRGAVERLRYEDSPRLIWQALERVGIRFGWFGWLLAALTAPVLMLLPLAIRLVAGRAPGQRPPSLFGDLVDRFAATFPQRPDKLRVSDCTPYTSVLSSWTALFKQYDIVQAYATDVALPLLTGFHPYVGFEHGTLRTFLFGDSPTCRLTALGYREADHVLITNGDCLEYAQRLGVQDYTAMIHPIDDGRIAEVPAVPHLMRERFGASRLFLCPLRHDWKIKGTDHYIRALPELAARIGRDFRVVMTRWGAQVDDSQALAVSLGVADLIAWIDPLNRRQLIEMQKSVDVVFDQIALPHFGATAPQAIAAGVPVIMSYDPASTAWIIPEPAPILSAWNAAEVVEGVVNALDPVWLERYRDEARRWFDKNHSGREAVRRLSMAYYDAAVAADVMRVNPDEQ